MPGPFPGMDPYLENPPRWGGVHIGLMAHACSRLNELLPPGYAADMGERVWIVRPERNVDPDVAVVRAPIPRPRASQAAARGAATADPPWVVTVDGVEMREVFVNITCVDEPDVVVAALEVLSPTNKKPGTEGRELYLKKQEEILSSTTHFLEIDLLRTGAYTVAAPRALLLEKGGWDYIVSLHRAHQGGRFEVWPTRLRARLPRVAVPLLDGDPDVVLDLQEVLDKAYDDGPYRRRVDYRRDPPVPLEPDDAAWADALLRERGLRGAG